MQEIYSRRSIRKYQDKPVDDKIITEILKAGMNSPSAKNLRPYEFIVVKDKDMLYRLSQIKPAGYMLETSAFAIISLARETCDFWQQDMGASTENMLLMAEHYDIGSCWIGIREEQDAIIRDIMGVPEDLHIFNIIAFGYKAEDKPANEFFDETRIHYEKY